MTSQQQLYCDCSTYANFSAWASAVSAFFAAAGWLQSTDTGQVMWSGMTLTAVAKSGSDCTYTYTSLAGLALAVSRTLTITGMTNGANNGTFRITALGAGTFTVVNASGVIESGSSGVVTKATTVPGSGLFNYEVWQPGDGLQTYYTKVEYGNFSTSNSPTIKVTISSATNGAGTPIGFIIGTLPCAGNTVTANSTTPCECNFSGDSGRIGIMLWRNGSRTDTQPQFFAIERSLNSSGTPTGSYVTVFVCGNQPTSGGNCYCYSQSLVFGVGAAPSGIVSQNGSWYARIPGCQNIVSLAFNGTIPFDTCAPMIGYYDYPCTVVGAACGGDVTEAVTFTATLYGATRTYLPSKVNIFSRIGTGGSVSTGALCMRFD